MEPAADEDALCKLLEQLKLGLPNAGMTGCLKEAMALLDQRSELSSEQETDLASLAMNVIRDARFNVEESLLAGTLFAKVLMMPVDSCQEDPHIVCSHFLNHFCKVAEEKSNGRRFDLFCLVGGILNCGGKTPKVLFSNLSVMIWLFEVIEAACQQPSTYQFQTFLLLRTWSGKIRKHARDVEWNIFATDSAIVKSCIDICMSNWENAVRGVPDLVKQIFADVLAVCEVKLDPNAFRQLVTQLWGSNMKNVSWKLKCKYAPMEVLLPYVGVDRVLSEGTETFAKLLCSQSLKSNYLAAAGVSVYRLLLASMDLAMWQRQFLSPLLGAMLNDEEPVVRANALNHWLPSTVHSFPGSVPLLLTSLARHPDRHHSWLARCHLVQLINQVQEPCNLFANYPWLVQCLDHFCPEVRVAAFGVLCRQRKRASPPAEQEMLHIKSFLSQNLWVDCAAFRQNLLSEFTHFMIRCRDFCVATFRRRGRGQPASGNDELVDTMMRVLRDLDEIMKLLFVNLFPGANYQRLITSLELLNIFCSCLFRFSASGVNKFSVNSNPTLLLDYVTHSHQLLLFYTSGHLDRLLVCLQHYMCDVRQMAASLLQNFTPDSATMRKVLTKSLRLLCSPRFSLCQSGALMMQLCQGYWTSKGVLQLQDFDLRGDQACEAVRNQLLADAMRQSSQEEDLVSFLLAMYGHLFRQMDSSKSIVEMSRQCPMHGLLTAIRACIEYAPSNVFSRVLALLTDSIMAMLQLLSGGKSQDPLANASFQEMGVAIDNLILQSQEEMTGEEDLERDVIGVSNSHSLVLAFGWLNLKESAFLLSSLVQTGRMAAGENSRACHLLTTMLTKCRHKGVLEATGQALGQMASFLMSQPDQITRDVPMQVLIQVLDTLDLPEASASVTRRSAGLPLLVRRIVAAEPRTRGQSRRLLDLSVNRLVKLASRGSELSVVSETEDTAQCHALHILQSLVHEASLAQDIMTFLDPILRCCVTNFSSPSWAVRNGSLQLFGSIVPRILGQKKVRDSGAGVHNTITMHEFFSRYAHLKDYLLDQLSRKCESGLLEPAWVPLLSLLSRVCQGDWPVAQEHDLQTLSRDFKRQFLRFFSCPVMKVRRLAAKAYANFTPFADLPSEIGVLCRLGLESGSRSTNLANGLLDCLINCIDMMKSESEAAVETQVADQVLQLSERLYPGTRCLIVKTQLRHLAQQVGLEPPTDDHPHLEAFHPGSSEWRGHFVSRDLTNLQITSHEEARHFIRSSLNPAGAMDVTLQQVGDFILVNAESGFLCGSMIEKCNLFMASREIRDAELALELLDVATHSQIASGKFGLGAMTSRLVLAARCFSGMMTQDDFSMFFQGGGPFVASFADFCDSVLRFSGPRCLETSRWHAALALNNLLPALTTRAPGSDFDMHMKYAWCQALNAAYVLLADEDSEIRHQSALFVCGLRIHRDNEQSLNLSSISPCLALNKLFVYMLEQLGDCAHWMLPVRELLMAAWQEPVVPVSDEAKSQVLFQNGDGVNVFQEPAVINCQLYSVLANIRLQDMRTLEVDLDLDMAVAAAQSLLAAHQSSDLQAPFTELYSNDGYLQSLRLRNLFALLVNMPPFLRLQRPVDQSLLPLVNDLRTKLITFA